MARTVDDDTGAPVLCTLKAGHDPTITPMLTGRRDPGGWHVSGGRIWSDAGAATPPTAP